MKAAAKGFYHRGHGGHKGALRIALACLMALPIFLWGASGAASPPDAAYIESFEKWKAGQIEDLKENWLPLAGLYWLKQGANAFGSDPENAVAFPKGPAHAGEFDLEGKDVSIKVLPEVHAMVAGKPLTNGKLETDVSGHPTLVEMGSLHFHVI